MTVSMPLNSPLVVCQKSQTSLGVNPSLNTCRYHQVLGVNSSLNTCRYNQVLTKLINPHVQGQSFFPTVDNVYFVKKKHLFQLPVN